MYTDIAIYKSVVEDRMEKIKNQTYGKKSYYKNKQTANWKIERYMILNILL